MGPCGTNPVEPRGTLWGHVDPCGTLSLETCGAQWDPPVGTSGTLWNPMGHCGTPGCVSRMSSIGCPQDVPGMSPGCPKDVPRMSPGCPQDVHRMFPGCPQDAPRMSLTEKAVASELEVGSCLRVYAALGDTVVIEVFPYRGDASTHRRS